ITLYANFNISTCASLQMLLHPFVTSILIGLGRVHKKADQTRHLQRRKVWPLGLILPPCLSILHSMID
ncbi:hypothetical protein EDD15DRAFT_2281204, partial [Pisolithus albus]